MKKCETISPYMRRPLVIDDFATSILNLLIYEENLIFFFNSVESHDCILIDPQAWTPHDVNLSLLYRPLPTLVTKM